MDFSSFSLPDKNRVELVNSVLAECHRGEILARARSATHVPYILTKDERATVLDFGRDVCFDQKSANSHALLRTCHFLAAAELPRRFDLEIGPDFRHVRGHACALVDNPRDETRLIRALRRGVDCSNICRGGAENCTYPAQYGRAVHSGYDISFAQWGQIFLNHGLLQVDLLLHDLPPENFTSKLGYSITYDEKREYVYFLPTDGTQGYRHRVDTWGAYFQNAGFTYTEGEARTVHISISAEGDKFGQKHLQLTRVSGRATHYYHRGSDGELEIPVLNQYPGAPEYILIPSEKYHAIVVWALGRTDSKFDYNSLACYMRAQRQRIVVGGVVNQQRWDVSAMDFHHLAITLFVHTSFLRYMRSKAIGHLVKRSRSEQERSHLIQFFIDFFHDHTEEWLLQSEDLRFNFSADTIAARVVSFERHAYLHIVSAWPFIEHCPRITVDEFVDALEDFDEVHGCPQLERPRRRRRKRRVRTPAPDTSVCNAAAGAIHASENAESAADCDACVNDTKLSPTCDLIPNYNACQHEYTTVFSDYLDSQHEILVQQLRSSIMRDDSFAASATRALPALVASQQRDLLPYITVTGPPGSGKSRRFKKSTCYTPENTVVCVPTREQRDVWLKCGFHAYTYHAFLALAIEKPYVIVDEFCAMHAGVISFALRSYRAVLIGDPKQIGLIDFELDGSVCDSHLIIENALAAYHRCATYRCPQDAAAFLSNHYNSLVSFSQVRRSITYSALDWRSAVGGQFLTFTQADKELVKSRFADVRTVHEAQGCTFDAVNLYVSTGAERLMHSSVSHCIVAVSRHLESLVVFGDGIANHYGCFSPLSAVMAGVPTEIYDAVNTPIAYEEVVEHIETDTLAWDQLKSEVYDLCSVFGTEIGFRPQMTEVEIHDGQLAMFADPNQQLRDVHRLGVHREACRTTCNEALAGPIGAAARYCKQVAKITTRDRQWAVRMLRAGLAKFIDLDSLHALADEECFYTSQYIRKAFEKSGSKIQQSFDNDEMSDVLAIKAFVKVQCKYGRDAYDKAKAPQGINAYSKEANAIFGPIMRTIESRLCRCLRPGVVYANAKTQREIDMAYAAAVACERYQLFANDFSEFDSTQQEACVDFEMLIYKFAGAPLEALSLLRAMRDSWTSRGVGYAVSNHYMRHSGECATLLGNTIVNMAACGAINDYSCVRFAGFKGDDSLIVADEITPLSEEFMDKFLRITALKIKSESTNPPVFLGRIMHERGSAPILRRVVAKLTEKNFDVATLDDQRNAIHDMLVADPCSREIMLLLNAFYEDDTYANSAILYDFLVGFADGTVTPSLQHLPDMRQNSDGSFV